MPISSGNNMYRLPPLDYDIGAAVVRRKNVARTGEENEPLLTQPQSAESPEQVRLLHVVIVVLVCCCCLSLLGAGIAAAVIGAGSGEGEAEGEGTTTVSVTTTVPVTTTTLPVPVPISTTAASVTALQAISLEFLCNVPFGNDTCRAVFTYNNPNDQDTVIAAGSSNNNVEPGPPNRGQPAVFKSGYHYGGATFLWNCAAHPYARWLVRSGPVGTASTAIALAAKEKCPPVPIGSSIGEIQAQRR